MTKIVVNKCYGGFSISLKAAELMGIEVDDFDRKYESHDWPGPRHDTKLVAAVEQLGSEGASGSHARLVVVETNEDLYQIGEYDGMEWVETPDTQHWINANE